MCSNSFSEINYFQGISSKEEELTIIYHNYSTHRQLCCEKCSAARRTQTRLLEYVRDFEELQY